MMLQNIASRRSRFPLSFPLVTKMPPFRRHLSLVFLCTLTLFLGFGALHPAAAQGKAETPAAKAQPAELMVPSAETIVVMIRSTLLSLDHAMATGNFTVFRDLAAPSLREANSAGRLAQIFSNLAAQRVSLAPVAILVPKLPEPPGVDANRRLRIAGVFPGDPVQISFDLQFEAVAGQWRLFGIAVNPTKPASPNAGSAPAAAVPPGDQTKPAPKGKPNK